MKKLINYKTVFSLVAILILACDDNLDIDPEQNLSPEVATSTPANVKTILNSIYFDVRSTDSYGGGIGLASELLGTATDLSWNGTFVGPAEYNEKAIVPNNDFVEPLWLNAYEINNEANIVLAHLDVFEDEDEKNTVEGEAKFLRALNYFDLTRLFSKPYNVGGNNSQPAVPIVLEPVLNASEIRYPERNTVQEVYNQVISDLTDAFSLLPDENGYFANKYSAEALLARAYLETGNYEGARDAASDVIENSGASLTANFSGAFNNSENSSEDLFAVQVTSQDESEHGFNVYWAGSDFGGRIGNPDISINEEHFNIYDDPEDDRANFFYTTSDGTATTKWQNQYGNIPIIRLAEMYLIRAEANERLGTAIGATPLEDINTLRERANASLYNSMDLETILKERKRELAFEGFALFDAKRLHKNVGTISYDADRLVLPIPLRELDANPSLTQNPGY